MQRSQSSPPSERANAQSGGNKSAAVPTAPQASSHIDDSYPRPLGVPGDVPRVPEGERYELTTAGRAELVGPRPDDPCADCGHELGPVYHELLELDGQVRRDGYRCPECQAAYLLSAFDSISGHVNNAAQIISLTRNLGHELTHAELAGIRRRLRAALYLLDGAR